VKQLLWRILNDAIGGQSRLEPEFMAVWDKIAPYTMTGIMRAHGLWSACNYVVKAGIPGDFVECGVWRGGSAMVMAHALQALGETRPIYLYDTYEGMVEPTEHDVSMNGESARAVWAKKRRGNGSAWCDASIEDVTANMASTGYPMDFVHLEKGRVEDTLPASDHKQIALLRLDTDWYESTALELRTLYPLLAERGVLIIDDYGHWRGSQKAVDEYLGGKLFLTRMDYTGRMAVKV
jgi:O-methyltransferase